MNKNFLWHSEAFRAYAERRKIGTDVKALTDAVCEELDQDYGYENQSETISAVQKRLEIGSEPIRRAIRMINYAWEWLKATDERRKRILLNDISGEGGYFKLIRIGIECLEKDGIRTLADLEKVAGGKVGEIPVEDSVDSSEAAAETEPMSGAAEPVSSRGELLEEPKEENEGSLPKKISDDFLKGEDWIDEVCRASNNLVKVVAGFGNKFQEMRADCIRYLDEMKAIQGSNAVISGQIAALTKKNQDLSGELDAVREEKRKLGWLYQETIAKLSKARSLLAQKEKEIGFLEEKNRKLEVFFRSFSELKAELNGMEDPSQEPTSPAAAPVSGSALAGSDGKIAKTSPKPASSNHLASIDLPAWSGFHKKSLAYHPKKAEGYFFGLNMKSRKRIVKSISVLCDQGPCRALRPKTIEGGEHNGRRRIRAGKFRLIFEELENCLYFHTFNRKGEHVDNIKG